MLDTIGLGDTEIDQNKAWRMPNSYLFEAFEAEFVLYTLCIALFIYIGYKSTVSTGGGEHPRCGALGPASGCRPFI